MEGALGRDEARPSGRARRTVLIAASLAVVPSLQRKTRVPGDAEDLHQALGERDAQAR